MQIKAEEISQIIKDQIGEFETSVDLNETGTVISVGDGIARVYGVMNCMAMELLEFGDGVMGLALNLEEDNVGVAVLGSVNKIKEGDIVKVADGIGGHHAGSVIEVLGIKAVASHLDSLKTKLFLELLQAFLCSTTLSTSSSRSSSLSGE